jgi:hypothetical protein
MNSRLVVTRGRNGTTVRATGAAADLLFAAIARSVGREVAKPEPSGLRVDVSIQPKHRLSFFEYLEQVRVELVRTHRLRLDVANARMDRDLNGIRDGFQTEVPAHFIAAAIAQD